MRPSCWILDILRICQSVRGDQLDKPAASMKQKGSFNLRRELGDLARGCRPSRATSARGAVRFSSAQVSAAAGYPLWPALIDELIKRTVVELGNSRRPRMPKPHPSGILMEPHYMTDATRIQGRAGADQEHRTTAAPTRQSGASLDVADQCRALLGRALRAAAP